MNKPHKYADVIKAWADGDRIQCSHDDRWMDLIELETHSPNFNDPNDKWRIKPKTLRYRVALMKYKSSNEFYPFATNYENTNIENDPDFVKWLTEWTEVEV